MVMMIMIATRTMTTMSTFLPARVPLLPKNAKGRTVGRSLSLRRNETSVSNRRHPILAHLRDRSYLYHLSVLEKILLQLFLLLIRLEDTPNVPYARIFNWISDCLIFVDIFGHTILRRGSISALHVIRSCHEKMLTRGIVNLSNILLYVMIVSLFPCNHSCTISYWFLALRMGWYIDSLLLSLKIVFVMISMSFPTCFTDTVYERALIILYYNFRLLFHLVRWLFEDLLWFSCLIYYWHSIIILRSNKYMYY